MQNNKIHTYMNISMSCVTIINILSFNSGKMPTKQGKNKVINNFWQVLTHNFFYIFKLKWLIFWHLLNDFRIFWIVLEFFRMLQNLSDFLESLGSF